MNTQADRVVCNSRELVITYNMIHNKTSYPVRQLPLQGLYKYIWQINMIKFFIF